MRMVEHCVPKGVREMSIRASLARAYPMLAGWALRDALKKRDVRVNGRKDAQCVRGGDVVRVYLPEKSLFAQPLSILYEDGDILALEKPSGLPVDVDADGVGEDTVARRLERLRPGAHIAHRLDAGTGGVLLAGKTPTGLNALLEAFASGGVQKEYRAVAVGRVEGERLLDGYLEKDAQRAQVAIRHAPVPGARRVLTRYRALGQSQEQGVWLTQLSVELLTGRTHQIRAHLADAGHPLLGDDKYGDRAANRTLGIFVPQLWCARLKCGGVEAYSAPKGKFFGE